MKPEQKPASQVLFPLPVITLLLLFVLHAAGCKSPQLLTRQDYYTPSEHLRQNNPRYAAFNLPRGEEGTFIKLMEWTYLRLLAGEPDIDKLAAYAVKADRQVRFKVTRDIKTLFYLDTPEGYYASEHEIVWMHLLLSWGYSLRGDPEKAAVEAKIASGLLSMNWSEEGRFDDPLLRLIMAGMWTLCGHWDEARVDLRVARDSDPSLKWLDELIRMEEPPKNLVILLGGTGPEPAWDPKPNANPFRGARHLKWRYEGERSPISMRDAKNRLIPLRISPDSSYWYRRHFRRDNALRDAFKDSRYSQSLLGSGIKTGTRTLVGITAGVGVAAAGTGAGLGILYLGMKAESAYAVGAGIGVIGAGFAGGAYVAHKITKEGIEEARRDLDISVSYRYVRFLPEYLWMGWSRREAAFPLKGQKKRHPLFTLEEKGLLSRKINGVILAFYPDRPEMGYPDIRTRDIGMGQETYFRSLTLLHRAIDEGELETVRSLVREGAPVDLKDDKGRSPLHYAARKQDPAYLKILLERRPALNTLNSEGRTPLIEAVSWNSPGAVRTLVEAGARLQDRDINRETPLTLAALFNRMEIVRILGEKGADIRAFNRRGWCALHYAAQAGNQEMAEFLLKKGARINQRTRSPHGDYPAGSTPLSVALISGEAKMADFLKTRGGTR